MSYNKINKTSNQRKYLFLHEALYSVTNFSKCMHSNNHVMNSFLSTTLAPSTDAESFVIFVNWMFFRNLSVLQKDHMQKNWKLSTSKINWKKRGVKLTALLRSSQMVSTLWCSVKSPPCSRILAPSLNTLNIWKIP